MAVLIYVPVVFLGLGHGGSRSFLGLNWFEETGAGVFPMEKILRFPGQWIHLSRCHRDDNDMEDNFFEIGDPMIDVCLSEVIDGEDIEEQDCHRVIVPEMTAVAILDKEQEKQFAQL